MLEILVQNFCQVQKEDTYAGQWIQFLSDNVKPVETRLLATFEKENDLHFIAEDGCVYSKFTEKTGKIRKQFIVPKNMIGKILGKLHNNPLSTHPGFFRTYRKIQMWYFWPTMKSDI